MHPEKSYSYHDDIEVDIDMDIDIPNPPPIIVVVETVVEKKKEPAQMILRFQRRHTDNSSHSTPPTKTILEAERQEGVVIDTESCPGCIKFGYWSSHFVR